MSKATVKAYYKKWASGEPNSQPAFIDMLQRKAYSAARQNDTAWAYDGLKTAKELSQMLVIADDLHSAGQL